MRAQKVSMKLSAENQFLMLYVQRVNISCIHIRFYAMRNFLVRSCKIHMFTIFYSDVCLSIFFAVYILFFDLCVKMYTWCGHQQ